MTDKKRSLLTLKDTPVQSFEIKPGGYICIVTGKRSVVRNGESVEQVYPKVHRLQSRAEKEAKRLVSIGKSRVLVAKVVTVEVKEP